MSRRTCEPRGEVNGKAAWVSLQNSVAGDAGLRAFNLRVADAAFRGENAPPVEIEAVLRHPASTHAELWVNTTAGFQKAGEKWGRSGDWQTLAARVDIPLFNRGGEEPDILVKARDGEFALHRVVVRALDPNVAPDFHRTTRFDGLDAAGRGRFVFEPGQIHAPGLNFFNLGRVPLDAVCEVSLNDDLDAPLWSRTLTATAPAAARFNFPVELDARDMPQGQYRLSFRLLQKGVAEPLVIRTLTFLVSETSPLPRARDGEFLYGVDPCYGFTDERFWEWADFMGADILRGFGCGADNPEAMARAIALNARHHFRPYFFGAVTWHPDDAERARINQRNAEQAAAQAKRYDPEGAGWWELGNEPDLTGFWPGPIEAYADAFAVVARAIKEAAPAATVMNGGLAFVKDEGRARSPRLIEVIPMDHLDAWAFHAHGPGAASERAAYERMLAATARFGKDTGAYAETESGFASSSPAQQRVQARTAIQKLVYSQSVNIRLFMWFRLLIYGHDADYSSLHNGNLEEPRPVILAYRTTVRHLRHLRFRETPDLAPVKGEAYFFADPEGERRALVLWTDDTTVTRAFQLPPGSREPVRSDMFGNTTPLPFTAPGTVAVQFSPDPVFVLWQSPGLATPVPEKSPVIPPAAFVLAPGADDFLNVDLLHTGDAPLDVVLSVEPGADSGVTVAADADARPPIRLRLLPNQSHCVGVAVTTQPRPPGLHWPRQWRVFYGLPADFNPGAPETIPVELNGVTGLDLAASPTGVIDLAAHGGGIRHRAPALLFAEVNAPGAGNYRAGASPDWWMEWFANGLRVYENLEKGNTGGRGQITDHTFDLPLDKGKNIIAARVLGGSQGWTIRSGGPVELAAAEAAGNPAKLISIVLRSPDGAVIAQETAPVRWRQRVADDTPGWRDAPPDVDFYDDVENFFVKEPDTSKWWRNRDDLSARAWFRADAENFVVRLLVTDDIHRPPATPPASPETTVDDYAWLLSRSKPVAPATVEREGARTLYTFLLPRAPAADFQFFIFDNDWGEPKQTLRSPVCPLCL